VTRMTLDMDDGEQLRSSDAATDIDGMKRRVAFGRTVAETSAYYKKPLSTRREIGGWMK
jgi:hypothetical protein